MKMDAEPIATASDSYDTGIRIGKALASEGLAYVLLLADGVRVNGSALARGVQEAIGSAVLVTGGLANDGTAFRSTRVVAGEQVLPNHAVAVGFYGNRLRVGHAAIGGWQPFGPDMVVTKVDGNTVYEFDGAPALSLYERYLGPEADELPAAGLYFPIAVYDDWGKPVGLVRTLLGIDRGRGPTRRPTSPAGFYSNGELGPLNPEAKCQLHNQTMTITLWAER